MKKIAIIGAAGFAAEKMLPELSHSKSCRIVAILGRNAERLNEVAKMYAVDKVFIDIKEMLGADKYDAIYISTPPYLHLENIKELAKTDSAILCEKPIARNLKEAKKIKDSIGSEVKSFILGHHMRHQKAVLDIKRIIENKKIGDVISVYGQWGYQLDPLAPYAKWKLDRELGGYSVVNDPGIHIIDLMYLLFGLPTSVSANGFSAKYKTTCDNAMAQLNYADKTIIIESSQTMDCPNNNLIIYGTKGTIEVPECFSQVYIPKVIIKTTNDIREIKYEPTYLYKNEMENLLGLSEVGLPGTNIDEAIEEMKILEMINISLEKKRTVFLSDLN